MLFAGMNCWAEHPIMEHAAWRKGKCASNQDATDVKTDHASAVSLDVASTNRKVSCGGAVKREKTERMDEAKMPQKPWPDVSWHEQRREPCRDHQEEIDSTKRLVYRRAFSPHKQECADEKCRRYRHKMEIGKLLVCHGNGLP